MKLKQKILSLAVILVLFAAVGLQAGPRFLAPCFIEQEEVAQEDFRLKDGRQKQEPGFYYTATPDEPGRFPARVLPLTARTCDERTRFIFSFLEDPHKVFNHSPPLISA